jgi:hypothetical protein
METLGHKYHKYSRRYNEFSDTYLYLQNHSWDFSKKSLIVILYISTFFSDVIFQNSEQLLVRWWAKV